MIKRGERRKRYGWLAIMTVGLWLLVGLIVFKVDPINLRDLILPGSYFVFGMILFAALFFTLSIVMLSAKKGLLWAVGIIVLLYLRIWRLGSLFGEISLLGLLVCGHMYFFGTKRA